MTRLVAPARRTAARGGVALALLAAGGCGGGAKAERPGGAPERPGAEAPAATPAPSLGAAATAHLRALARIAARNRQTRAAGTSGYDASVEYVAGRLRAAGYRVTLQPVPFPVFRERSRPRLTVAGARVAVRTLAYSPPGRVRAPLARAGLGCRAGDFGAVRRRIALVERGRCTFREQARFAQAAGARAIVVADPAAAPTVRGSLGRPGIRIPAVAAGSGALGLRGRARLAVDTVSATERTRNVLAERPEARAGRVAMLGAHLDSVREGPGINDNGSGTASALALAERLGDRRGLRFAFWGAEELGLYGSRRYVDSLAPAERRRIAGYVNLDMVGSPNAVRFVYGAGRVRAALEAALRARGLRFERTSVHGASDHAPFARAGISVGGLYSGAQERKTARQARAYGGRAGRPLDPCYHRRCDTFGRVDRRMLEQLAGAAGRALLAIL